MRDIETYFIDDISIKIVQSPEIYYSKRPEMHPIRRNDPILPIEMDVFKTTAQRFKIKNKVFYLAYRPEIENFLGLQLSELCSLQEEVDSLRKSLIDSRKETKLIKSLSFFGRLKFLLTGKVPT